MIRSVLMILDWWEVKIFISHIFVKQTSVNLSTQRPLGGVAYLLHECIVMAIILCVPI